MEFSEDKAIYLQIADLICEKILRNEWHPEEKIPSIRDMAMQLEVNPNTVVRTYTFLEDKNIINKQRGIGYFIDKEAFSKTLILRKEDFFQQDLPKLITTLKLLNIEFDELKAYLKETKELIHENQH